MSFVVLSQFHLIMRYLGIQLAKPSLRSFVILSAPRSDDSGFRMAEWTRYRTGGAPCLSVFLMELEAIVLK